MSNEHEYHIDILYGSETGTAEELAFKVHAILHRLPISSKVQCMDHYDVNNLEFGTIIFITSTTGEGAVPANMSKFWKYLLRKNLPTNMLERLNFAVFGLGDSSYEIFNAAARKLSARLKQLGANAIIGLGSGDDQAKYGYLTAFDPWLRNLLGILLPTVNNVNIDPYLSDEQYQIDIESSEIEPLITLSEPKNCHLRTSLLSLGVHDNQRMTSSSWNQAIHHISLKPKDTNVLLSHVAGDILVVQPENPLETTNMALSLFQAEFPRPDTIVNIHRKTYMNIRHNRIDAHLRCTLSQLFTSYLEIGGIPTRTFFETLSFFATNDEEKDKLMEIASPAGTDLYFDYCIREKRNFVEVLSEFKSCKLPLSRFIELVPLLQPRHYSICSSSLYSPNQVDLCVLNEQRTTPYGRVRYGVCSSYLASRRVGDCIRCWIRKGTFPSCASMSESSHLLMVGPGTGVAPMRAYLQERYLHYREVARTSVGKEYNHDEAFMGKTALFFGCRSQFDDYIYKDDFEYFTGGDVVIPLTASLGDINSTSSESVLNESTRCQSLCSTSFNTSVVVGFSQKGLNATSRVTNCLEKFGSDIWKFLVNKDLYIIVAGSSKMPKDVKQSFRNIISSHGGLNEEDTKKFILQLEKSGRYIVESWT